MKLWIQITMGVGILVLTGSLFFQPVYAPPCFDGRPVSSLEYSDFTDAIFVGEVISKQVVDPDRVYADYDIEFKVEKVLKGEMQEFITIRSPQSGYVTVFELGEKYIVWASYEDEILNHYYCSPSDNYFERTEKFIEKLLSKRLDYISPKKQFDSGIPFNEIICREKMKLIVKFDQSSIACVSYYAAERLIDRGWGRPVFFGMWGDDKISDVELKQEVVQLKEENSQLNQQSDLESDVELYEISIVGDNSCETKTNQALEILKSKAKNHFEIITTYVGVIECVDEGSGIRVWDTPPRFQAGKETIDAGTIWYAGTIAHDSCHSKLYSDYLKNNPESNTVPSDIYTGRNAEAECLSFQYDTLVLMGASQLFLDHVKNIIESEYWEIPYEDRWW